MKFKVTRKEMKQKASRIISVGYCSAQYLLKGLDLCAYSTRAEGWACDYYNLGGGIYISEGYAPIGENVDYNTLREYDKKAMAIYNNYDEDYQIRLDKIDKIRGEWLATL
jgi:hypothetical protein